MATFLDPFLAMFRRTKPPPTTMVGTGGTAVWGGYVQSRETSSDLQGDQKWKTYSDIVANVSVVAQGVRFFLGLVGKAGWKVEPAEGGGQQAEDIAEAVTQIMEKELATPWHKVVKRAALYRFWGFSVQEWQAGRREDGSRGIVDVGLRPAKTIDRWDVDVNGNVQGMIQLSPQTLQEIYLPRGKVIYLVDDTLTDSPEGIGLLRHCAEPARVYKRLEQLEGYGYEMDLSGMPVARAPLAALERMKNNGEITAEQITAMTQILRDFIDHHIKSPARGLLLDSMTYQTTDERASPSNVYQWDMDIIRGDSANLQWIAKAIERKTLDLARVLGTEHLLLGDTGVGSLAMSRDKSQNFALTVDGALREIREVFQKDFLGPLAVLNGWPTEMIPELKTDAITSRSVEEVASALEQMARAGATLDPSDPVIGEVRDLMGLSHPIVIPEADAAIGAPVPGQNGAVQHDPEDDADAESVGTPQNRISGMIGNDEET